MLAGEGGLTAVVAVPPPFLHIINSIIIKATAMPDISAVTLFLGWVAVLILKVAHPFEVLE